MLITDQKKEALIFSVRFHSDLQFTKLLGKTDFNLLYYKHK